MASNVLNSPDRLLLSAISRAEDQADRVDALLMAEDFSWKRAFYVAESNRSALFVDEHLRTVARPERIGEEARQQWKELRRDLETRTSTGIEQVREVGEILHRVGVEPLLYKGPDFLTRFYVDNQRRTFSDIDVIVREHDVERTADALVDAGYRQPDGSASLDYYRRFHLHASYLRDGRLPLELHWALDSPYSGLPDVVPKLFEAAVPSEHLGPHVLCPAPLDALALMVIHLDKHVGLTASLPTPEARIKSVIESFGLVWVFDVVQWMRCFGGRYGEEETLHRMRELSAERELVIALRLAHDLDPDSLPAWAEEQSGRVPGGRPWISRIMYPDLSKGIAPTPAGSRRRAFLQRNLPGLGFRPIRVIETLLPSVRVTGVERQKIGVRFGSAVRRAGLGAANLLAIAS